MGITEQMAIECLDYLLSDCVYIENYVHSREFLEASNVIRRTLEEIQPYRTIGTVEELQALKEKATPKKPIAKEHSFDWFGTKQVRTNYFCPCCKKRVEHDFCTCGQRIDWRKVEGEH